MKRSNIGATLLSLAIILAGLTIVPVPWYATAPVIAQPDEVRNVYTWDTGRLMVLHVKPGDVVNKGDLLAELQSDLLDDQIDKAENEVKRREIGLRHAIAQTESAAKLIAHKQLNNAIRSRDQLREQVEQLTLRAPISGRVISGPARPDDSYAKRRGEGASWSGLPTSESNIGAVFEEGTHFISIAPNEKTRVLVHVTQEQRNDLALGEEVSLRFDSAPDQLFQGVVQELGDENQVEVDPSLTTRFGGSLTTVADGFGRERLVDRIYVAKVVLPDATHIHPGTRGLACFGRESRSVMWWAWRAFRTTFALSG